MAQGQHAEAREMLNPEMPAGRPAPRRSRFWGVAMGVVWLAGIAIGAYAVYVDDWRPLLAILPLLLVDDVLLDKWIASDPEQIEREAREDDELFTEEEEEALADLPDDADALDEYSFILDHPELVTRFKYKFREALVLRSAATATEIVGWLLFVVAVPGQPLLGALGVLLALAASGNSVYRLTRVLTPRFRVRATDHERRGWLRRDRIVEYAGWGAVAVVAGYKLIEGHY